MKGIRQALLYALLPLAMLMANKGFAQHTDTLVRDDDQLLERQYEDYIERSDQELDLSDWKDELKVLEHNPVNLNSGDENELRRLLLLNELQIQNLLAYTQQFGVMASIYELQVIEGFNEEFVAQLLPYITLTPAVIEKFSAAKALKYGKHDLMLRYQRILQKQTGYEKVPDSVLALSPGKYYLGSPDALMLRYEYSYKDFVRLGFQAEKDAGEALLPAIDSLRKGFDFYSAHLFMRHLGKVKALALGDYHVQFGQGLTLWDGFALGKSTGQLATRRHSSPLRPHTSANEFAFMRGAAATVDLGQFDVTAFGSYRALDASVSGYDTLLAEDILGTIQQTGYHRTLSEIASKNDVHQLLVGGHVTYQPKSFQIGATIFQSSYSQSFAPTTVLYKKFYPDQQQGTYAGVDYAWGFHKLSVYGEISSQLQYGMAWLQGMSFSPDPRVTIVAIYRNYSKDYYNPLGNAFGENSMNNNESGMYLGVVAMPFKKISCNAYTDLWHSKWMRYRVDGPSQGNEAAAWVTYNISRAGDLVFTYRFRQNAINQLNPDGHFNNLVPVQAHNFRLQFNYQALPWMRSQTRVEWNHRKQDGSASGSGYLMYQGLTFKPVQKEWTLYLRYALFNTDTYDTRIYTFENDVPYTFSVPSFSGNGSRFYLMASFPLGTNVDLMLRYSNTAYFDKDLISSGTDEIKGSNKSEFRAVMHMKF